MKRCFWCGKDSGSCLIAYGSIVIPIIGMLIYGGWLYHDGKAAGERSTRAAAIKAGVGRYVADPRTGETRFEWGK